MIKMTAEILETVVKIIGTRERIKIRSGDPTVIDTFTAWRSRYTPGDDTWYVEAPSMFKSKRKTNTECGSFQTKTFKKTQKNN